MEIGNIFNAETGLSVRGKLNEVIDRINSQGGETLTPDTVNVYSPNQIGGYIQGSIVAYSSATPGFETPKLYRALEDIPTGQSPEDHPLKWYNEGEEFDVVTSNTSTSVVTTIAELKAIAGMKTGDTVIVMSARYWYRFNSNLETGIKPNDGSVGSWAIQSRFGGLASIAESSNVAIRAIEDSTADVDVLNYTTGAMYEFKDASMGVDDGTEDSEYLKPNNIAVGNPGRWQRVSVLVTKDTAQVITGEKTFTEYLGIEGDDHPYLRIHATGGFPIIGLKKAGGATWFIENGRVTTELGLFVGGATRFTFSEGGTFTAEKVRIESASYPSLMITANGTFPLITLDKVGGTSWNIENGRVGTELGLRVNGATRFTFSGGGGFTAKNLAASDKLFIGTTTPPSAGSGALRPLVRDAATGEVKLGVTQTPQTLTQAGGSLTMNVANGYNARVTLTANITTFTFSGAVAGDSGVLTVIQDATGGRTMVMPTGHLREGGALTLSTAASARDILGWYYDGVKYMWNIGKSFA